MKKNIIFILTVTASRQSIGFHHRIANDLKKLNRNIKPHFVPSHEIETYFKKHTELTPRNSIIHVRAAHPISHWIEGLSELQERKFRVINKTEVVQLTSNKTQCAVKLYDSPATHPESWYGYRGEKDWKRNFKEIKTE